jgi:hypothetical protein
VPKSSSFHQFPRLSILNLDQTYSFICFDMARHRGSVRGICWHILPFVATYDHRTLKEAFLSYLSSTLFYTRCYCSEYRCASARKLYFTISILHSEYRVLLTMTRHLYLIIRSSMTLSRQGLHVSDIYFVSVPLPHTTRSSVPQLRNSAKSRTCVHRCCPPVIRNSTR